MRILVIEDDELLSDLLSTTLTDSGYTVDAAASGTEARALVKSNTYEGIVLDVVLPDTSGFDLARELRHGGISTPILMLTAKRETENLVKGLDSGADDYLVKPFRQEELQARLRALLRRGGSGRPDQLAFADIVLDRISHEARIGSQALRLTPREYSLLEYFLLHPEEIVARQTLLEQVWGIRFDPGTNVVEVHITRLRGKLKHSEAQLATVRGRGYILVGGEEEANRFS